MIYSFQNASFRDGETGLYNQAYFMEVFNREWHRLMRDKAALSILFLNPHINLSNSIEKECFIQIAHLLEELTYRSSDIICRFDDKFFAIGLFDLNKQGTNVIVKRIQKEIEQNIKLRSTAVNITVGATNVLPSTSILIENLFEKTAMTLTEAEHQGTNAYTIHQLH
ncbi:GGDEF domain-containing protein [Pseudoalteromonas denitrificans]|uniref:Diguanylate cyclase n=1 Tax=Pseudoalteromonas denitrificans DSM 6059 TaxID=1123010 RepID=A0A1I1I0X9_9GAMM|nr:diguanylate cyclase [Pseudoalteromonas denitrificans]SFC29472.1 diguanylate cyclase [Pseudoalteromonas denitrificans DSM 6059]